MAKIDDSELKLRDSINEAVATTIAYQDKLNSKVDDYKQGLKGAGIELGLEFKNVLSVQTQINKALGSTLHIEEAIEDAAVRYNRVKKARATVESQINQLTERRRQLEASFDEPLKKQYESYKKNTEEIENQKRLITESSDELRKAADRRDTELETAKNLTNEAQKEYDLVKRRKKTDAEKIKAYQTLAEAKLKEKQISDEINSSTLGSTQKRIKAEERVADILKEQAGYEKAAKKGIALDLAEQGLEALDKLKEELDRIKVSKVSIVQDKLTKATSLITSAKAMAASMKGAIDYFFEADTQVTNLSKNSGLSANYTEQIRNGYKDIASNLKTVNPDLNKGLLTIKGQVDAQNQLQATTETLSLYTQDRVQSQMFLTKQVGLEAETAAKLANLASLNSQSTRDTYRTITQVTATVNKENKIRLDQRAIMKDVAKASGVASANYKNDPKALAEAVAQAKALGTTLERTAGAAKALLNWEQSIEDQLEFEVLTGKAINLDRARSLALAGKTVEAEKAVIREIGTRADFEKANLYVKESAAKVLGKTTDELADQFRLADLLKTSSEETKAAYEEGLATIKDASTQAKLKAEFEGATNATQLESISKQVSKQVEFEESIERVKESMMEIWKGPVGGMVKGFTDIMKNTGLVKTLLGAATIYTGLMAANSIRTALASAATAFGLGNFAGGAVALGILAAAGVGASYAVGSALSGGGTSAGEGSVTSGVVKPPKSANDALISPSGQIMISTPEGMIKPNAKDSIIATTNPGALLGGGSSSKTEQLLAAILAKVNQPAPIFMNGDRLTTSLGKGYTSYA